LVIFETNDGPEGGELSERGGRTAAAAAAGLSTATHMLASDGKIIAAAAAVYATETGDDDMASKIACKFVHASREKKCALVRK